VGLDLVDPDRRVLLTVALLLPVVLPALPLEDDHLLALAMLHHLAGDGRAVEPGRSYANAVIGLGDQDVVERDGLADVRLQRRDLDRLTGLGPELLSARADDRVHVRLAFNWYTDRETWAKLARASSPPAANRRGTGQ